MLNLLIEMRSNIKNGSISKCQMELLLIVTEGSVLFKRLILEVGMWPKRKSQRLVATTHDLIFDQGGEPLVV